MNCIKTGNLIFSLRKEKNMTQKQLADLINISDKTISKWERGLGCPDISLLNDLSKILNVNIEQLLLGDLNYNLKNGGNMKKNKFYICPNCQNIHTTTGESNISCCGRTLSESIPKQADEDHKLIVQEIENDLYITFTHEMSKSHYISFIAYLDYNKMLLIKLYPEQGGEVRFPKMSDGKIYFYCSKNGLMYN